jgi:uncharacterized protein (DUF302 family)
MSLNAANSPCSVGETVDRLLAALERRGITVFARVDHAAGARAAGLELADEQVVIFGDPRAGTGLMQDDATIGYELPLRLLVWDAGGQTMIGYRPPTELGGEYHVTGHAEVLSRMEGLLGRLVAESTEPDD